METILAIYCMYPNTEQRQVALIKHFSLLSCIAEQAGDWYASETLAKTAWEMRQIAQERKAR